MINIEGISIEKFIKYDTLYKFDRKPVLVMKARDVVFRWNQQKGLNNQTLFQCNIFISIRKIIDSRLVLISISLQREIKLFTNLSLKTL